MERKRNNNKKGGRKVPWFAGESAEYVDNNILFSLNVYILILTSSVRVLVVFWLGGVLVFSVFLVNPPDLPQSYCMEGVRDKFMF